MKKPVPPRRQKTISLPDDVYKKLKEEKKDDESFAQLILRLLKKEVTQSQIEPLAGVFAKEADEWAEIEKTLYSDRLRQSERGMDSIEE